MRDVFIIGVGQSIFGKLPNMSAGELGLEAVSKAIDDAGVTPKDLEVVYGARLYDAMTTSQSIMKRLGVAAIEMINVENACAGGATSVRCLYKDIASGLYDIGVAVGVESMTTSPVAGKLIPPQKDDLDGQLGLTMPTLFALLARRLMETHGATVEDFAQVSVKNHRHGCLNPQAQYQKEFTIEEILKSRMIADPITLLQCCPNTDGAAAIILCSRKAAGRFKVTAKPVKIAASVLLSADFFFKKSDLTSFNVGKAAAQQAYEKAGIDPKDLDVIELHDAFACEEMIHYEDMGICQTGESVSLLRSGATSLGGRIPVNPSGGLLSLGHPLAASGTRVIGEIALQLRNQAGKRQVKNAKIGMAQMLGGSESGLEAGACGIHILTK